MTPIVLPAAHERKERMTNDPSEMGNIFGDRCTESCATYARIRSRVYQKQDQILSGPNPSLDDVQELERRSVLAEQRQSRDRVAAMPWTAHRMPRWAI